MKLLAYLMLLIPGVAMAFPAITNVPPPSGMYYSTDGTGNPGTWTPVSGGGAGAISWVPPAAAMYCSSDGSGNPGTWVPCNPSGGGGGSLPTATQAGQAPVSTGPGTTYTAQLVAPSGGVWQREGTVLSPTQGEEYNASEPTLIYEGNPQILTSASGSIFKMWWNCGFTTTGLCYAESYDAENWVRAANPVIARVFNTGVAHGYVFHYNSTYYFYAGNGAQTAHQYDMYTSPDGVTWTLAHSAVLTTGTTGTWDSSLLGNVFVIPSAGTWQMMYEAWGTGSNVFLLGVATSSDQGVTWVKNGSNPVLKGPSNGEAAGPEIHLVGSTYYVWYTCNTGNVAFTPTDICRAHSTNFTTWTPDSSINPTFTRATFDEGVNNSNGQVADPSMVQVGNTIYMAYDGVYAQNGTSPDAFHLKLATAPYTFAQLVQTNEGNSTNIHASGSFESLNLFPCTYWDYNLTVARVPCPTTGVFNVGLLNMLGSSTTPGTNYNIYNNGTNDLYTSTGGAAKVYEDTAGALLHVAAAPSGTAGTQAASIDALTVSNTGTTFKNNVSLQTQTIVNTVFNEGTVGANLTGTKPATNLINTTWIPWPGAIGWTYKSGGGALQPSNGGSLLNIGVPDVKITYSGIVNTSEIIYTFRFTDQNNWMAVETLGAGGVALVETISGTPSTVGTSAVTNGTSGSIVVTLSGQSVNVVPFNGTPINYTIPSGHAAITGTNVGAYGISGTSQTWGGLTIVSPTSAISSAGFNLDTSGNITGASVKTASYTVATLPSAATLGAGAQVIVTDATTFTPGTCTGGGSDYMIAVSNGSTWSCH